MADVLAAVVAVGLIGATALAVLTALTVVPFVLTLQWAERRGVASGRAGALATATCLVGPAAALWLTARTPLPIPLAALPLVLVVSGPAVAAAAPRWLGRRGRHEPRAP